VRAWQKKNANGLLNNERPEGHGHSGDVCEIA